MRYHSFDACSTSCSGLTVFMKPQHRADTLYRCCIVVNHLWCCPGCSQSRHSVRKNPDDRSLFLILSTMKNIFCPTLLSSILILFYFMHVITIFLLSSTIVGWFYLALTRRKREKFQVMRSPLLLRTMRQLYPVISCAWVLLQQWSKGKPNLHSHCLKEIIHVRIFWKTKKNSSCFINLQKDEST